MNYEMKIKMVIEVENDEKYEDIEIATLSHTIEITAADDEETLQEKVYEAVEEWTAKTGNVGCEARYNLTPALKIAAKM
jgi:hypothetical protein